MNDGATSAGFGFTPIGKVKAKRLRWLIERIVPAATLVFVSAQAKQGKSLLALYMSLCLTAGKLFLGQFRTRRSRVLYYSLEDHLGELRARAKHLLQCVGVERFPRYLLMSDAQAVNLPNDFSKIEADIRTSKATIVIIDTLRRSHGLEENSSTDMAPILRELRRLVREYKVTIIVVHHAGHKIKDKEDPGDWLRGTSDHNASWEVLIGLDRLARLVKARVFHKYRSPLLLLYETVRGEQLDKETGDYPIIGLKLCLSSEDEEDEQAVVTALTGGPLSGNELERRLKGKLSRPRIDAALKRLGEKSMVLLVGQGKNSKWELIRPAK
jgi:archaellum biogenesis ATPase FlaH